MNRLDCVKVNLKKENIQKRYPVLSMNEKRLAAFLRGWTCQQKKSLLIPGKVLIASILHEHGLERNSILPILV
jgi:hypothetical protein